MGILYIVNCNYEKMLKLSKHLEENDYYQDGEDKIHFSFEKLRFIEPAGAVIFLSIMDNIIKANYEYHLEPIENLNQGAISYGETMGFFQKLGLSTARSSTVGNTYIAPTKVVLKDLHAQLRTESKTIEYYYDEIAEDIVNRNLRDSNIGNQVNIKDLFIFVIREMIRNVFDHSESEHYYYMSQLYSGADSVEVVLADLGVGLINTIPFDVEYKWFNELTDEAAIHHAILPGLTAQSNHAYAPEDYKNSGYGLALVKRIIEETGGCFAIATGKTSISFQSTGETVKECDFPGTLIRMRINLRELAKVDFDEVLKETQRVAMELGFETIPSSASKTLKSKSL